MVTLKKFVDELPKPGMLRPKGKHYGLTYYEVEMKQVQQKLHRDLPPTTVWTYEGVYPGPTFEARRFEPILVKWINALPDEHLLPVDRTVHGAEPPNPLVRTVTHLHGGNVPPESDGYPEAWFTRNFEETGPFFTTKTYYYPNHQLPATLWYHDHALGITRLNVYAGLAGFYLLRDDFEENLNLPSGDYEVPVMIQDRSFNSDGSLFYPAPSEPLDPSIVPEFFGNTAMINGVAWPYLEVEPRKYRIRFLNGSNSRFYRMRLSSGQPFYQIGTDCGLLQAPVVTPELLMGPGERIDAVIDFSEHPGEFITLTNDAPAPFAPDGELPADDPMREIMQFRVVLPLSEPDTSRIPESLRPIERLDPDSARKVRDLYLVETEDQFGRLLLRLDNKRWDDPISEKPLLGTTEVWNLINITPHTHPIHLHLVQFRILGRQRFDMAEYEATGKMVYTRPRLSPPATEAGWKDTVQANPGEVTSIITRFGDFPGLYVWLEHGDHETMRPYMVVSECYCPRVPVLIFDHVNCINLHNGACETWRAALPCTAE